MCRRSQGHHLCCQGRRVGCGDSSGCRRDGDGWGWGAVTPGHQHACAIARSITTTSTRLAAFPLQVITPPPPRHHPAAASCTSAAQSPSLAWCEAPGCTQRARTHARGSVNTTPGSHNAMRTGGPTHRLPHPLRVRQLDKQSKQREECQAAQEHGEALAAADVGGIEIQRGLRRHRIVPDQVIVLGQLQTWEQASTQASTHACTRAKEAEHQRRQRWEGAAGAVAPKPAAPGPARTAAASWRRGRRLAESRRSWIPARSVPAVAASSPLHERPWQSTTTHCARTALLHKKNAQKRKRELYTIL